jgi:hypothetical protein
MPNLVFNYPEKKIEKLDQYAAEETRTRSSYIQKVLLDYINKKTIIVPKKKIRKKK